MTSETSAVLEFGTPEPGETAAMMEDKLRFHTDSWDLSVDLKAGRAAIFVIDTRSRDAYIAGHILQLLPSFSPRGNERRKRHEKPAWLGKEP